MIGDWIFEDNLKPLVEILSMFAGYGFDDGDWDAVEFGIKDTNVEQDAWFTYELVGANPVKVALAHDPGTAVVFVQAETDQETETKIRAVLSVLQSHRLLPR